MTKRSFWGMVIIAFFVGSIGSILFTRAIIPYLATVPGLSALRNIVSDAPIVINHREEIQIDDGVNLLELTRQAQSSVVSIYVGAANRLAGSGIILTSDGLIATSRNVLGDAKEATVVLNDGRSFPALVRAMDTKSELALITIEAASLNAVEFDDPSQLQAGQRLFALGKTTQEFTRQFSTGVVTRTLSNLSNPEQIFYTEEIGESLGVSLNLGQDFLGGPLLDLEGRMAGLIVSANGKIVTSPAINQVLTSYLSNGKVQRPYLGLRYQIFSKTSAGLKNLPSAGIVVTGIEPGSPLAGNLRINDLIVAVDNTNLESASFERLINQHQPGIVTLDIVRADSPLEITFELQLR